MSCEIRPGQEVRISVEGVENPQNEPCNHCAFLYFAAYRSLKDVGGIDAYANCRRYKGGRIITNFIVDYAEQSKIAHTNQGSILNRAGGAKQVNEQIVFSEQCALLGGPSNLNISVW